MFQAVTFGALPFHPSKALENGFWNRHSEETLSTPREDGVHWGTNNPRHPARHVTGALFVRNSLLRGKAAKFHRIFLLFNRSRHCHGGGSSVNLQIFQLSGVVPSAMQPVSWQVKFCTFLHGASRRSHSLLLGAFGAMAPTSKKFEVGMWIKVIQMQVLSLGIRVNLR